MKQSANLTTSPLYSLLILTTTALGIALIRGFLPLLLFVMRDRIGWTAVQLGVAALLLFLTAVFAALLNRLIGTGRLLAATAVVVALSSLLLQFWPGDPLLDLIVSGLGVVGFILFLPTIFGVQIAPKPDDKRTTTTALLGGLLLALVIHGSGRTYDLMWQQGLLAGLVLVMLVAGQLFCLVSLRSQFATAETADPPGIRAVAWTAFGPFLSLHLLVFLNLARLTTFSGWLLPAAFLALTLAYLVGIGLLFAPLRWRQGVAAGGLLLMLLALVAEWQVVLTVVGVPVTAVLLQGVVEFLTRRRTYSGLGRLTIAHTLGMVLLAAHVFITYARFDIALPLLDGTLLLAALLWLALWGFLGLRGPENLLTVDGRGRWVLAALPLLLALPVWQWVAWQTPQPQPLEAPLRVMTYNLHNGFNPQGLLDLETLAQVIEAEGADVVGLQEVSRGWVVNGSVDMLTWLEQRLGMTAVFTPTSDDLWGVAILSRAPILSQTDGLLPPDDLLLRRGWQAVEIDVTGQRPLTIVNTHLHHKRDGSLVRQGQVETLLSLHANSQRTVIMGDFNAEPAAVAMALFWDAGWLDAIAIDGVQPGWTSPVPDPRRRIDFLLLSSDLSVQDVVIPAVPASDHLPVAATVGGG